jgi:hypothetical protein
MICAGQKIQAKKDTFRCSPLVLVLKQSLGTRTERLEPQRGGDVKAQGNALGNATRLSLSPKGARWALSASSRPFGALIPLVPFLSQVVALGFNITAPLGLKSGNVQFFTNLVSSASQSRAISQQCGE